MLLGVEASDTEEDLLWLCGKMVRLRIFDDEHGVMNLSVKEASGRILLVSQFTLLASTRKGNRPNYSRAAAPEMAKALYAKAIETLTSELGEPIQTGEFGAEMLVQLVNWGPGDHYPRFKGPRIMREGQVPSLLVKLGFHANGMEIIQRRVDPLLGTAGLPW